MIGPLRRPACLVCSALGAASAAKARRVYVRFPFQGEAGVWPQKSGCPFPQAMEEINPERGGIRVLCHTGSPIPFGVRSGHARGADADPFARYKTEIGDWRLEIRPHLSTPVKEGWRFGG
jgi:hypothetical protein